MAGAMANETTNPLEGDRSIKYTQATGSLNDYFDATPIFPALASQRGKPSEFKLLYTYNGLDSDLDFIIYDITNAVELYRAALPAAEETTTFTATFTIPENSAAITYGFQVMSENDTKILVFDKVQVSANPETQTNTLEIPTLRLTDKENVVVELYRTENNGTIFYKVTDVASPTFNSKTVDTVTIVDTLSDCRS